MIDNLRRPADATHFVLRDDLLPNQQHTSTVTVLWLKNTTLGWMVWVLDDEDFQWRLVEQNIVGELTNLHHILEIAQ